MSDEKDLFYLGL